MDVGLVDFSGPNSRIQCLDTHILADMACGWSLRTRLATTLGQAVQLPGCLLEYSSKYPQEQPLSHAFTYSRKPATRCKGVIGAGWVALSPLKDVVAWSTSFVLRSCRYGRPLCLGTRWRGLVNYTRTASKIVHPPTPNTTSSHSIHLASSRALIRARACCSCFHLTMR